VDAADGELRRGSKPVKMREQSFRILVFLLEHSGEIVTRESLRGVLWPSDTFVDFDHSLNTAVMKLRDALGDSADTPLYIETLPKRGYRFIAPMTVVERETPSISPMPSSGPASAPLRPGECNEGAARTEDGFRVTVLAFEYSGADAEVAAMAEGLSKGIMAGLQRFSYLRVIACTSISRYADDAVGVRRIGKEPGARYLLEGEICQAGPRLRIAARLVDAASGANLWAESYERLFKPGAVFELQDDVVPRIVSTVGDARGVLTRTISEALRARDIDQLSPYEAVLRSFGHFQRVSEEEHAASTAALERAVQLAPGHADCWAMLSLLYKEEYAHGFNVRPDPLGRAFAAAHHAIEADPSNHLGYHALASVLYFRHEIEAFRGAAERAMARNPMDGFTIAYLGFLVAYSGEWERGCALVERARSLNPHHPGWYWFAHLFDAYRKRDYRGAAEIGRKINMPRFWRTNVALAAAYGQLGERDAARNAVQALVTSRPEFTLVAREELAKWWDPKLVEHLIDGLRKAGLEIHDAESGYSASPAFARSPPSSAAKMAELPLAYRKVWRILVPAVVLVAVAIAGAFYYRSRQATHRLTEKDTIVLADFANSTGDAIFDDTLKTALNISLQQSPFLNVLSDSEVTRSLQLMSRPAGTKLTPEIARELCQRAGSKAYIGGAIGSLGSQYVLELKAVNCQSGDALVQEQVTAASKEKVLDALGKAASQLRTELGESLATVKKFDVPLEEATTSSLEALKAYSLGHYQHAIELDPNFARGYLAVGAGWTLSERGRAAEYITKAFQLRDHASEREKLLITGVYYSSVTGELDKAAQTFQEVIKSYPRDGPPYDSLGGVYAQQGQYEKAVEMARQSMALAPDNVTATYSNLANYVLALQHFDEARQIIHVALARNLDDRIAHNALYALAFLGADSRAMAEQQQWFGSKPDYANVGLALASDTEAYAGHLRKARELAKQSVGSAIRAGDKESGAIWQENAALREAAYGNAAEARASAAAALKLAPGSQGAEAEAALAFAMAGDTVRAESLAQDLEKRYPLDTQTQSLWLPAIQAQLALDRRNSTLALNALQAASSIELGQIMFLINTSCLYPVYVRGDAYLAAGQGSAAAAEFQKILDHSGIVWNCWTGALAHLGVARANALQAQTSQGANADLARTRARAAYKDFLTLWKDADPDISVLRQARAEYAKLQ
jgi:TolB-like protein/DNA-binding winged helix-turn-helix (wHTH) protein/Tfp pilus assembly protein PilF